LFLSATTGLRSVVALESISLRVGVVVAGTGIERHFQIDNPFWGDRAAKVWEVSLDYLRRRIGGGYIPSAPAAAGCVSLHNEVAKQVVLEALSKKCRASVLARNVGMLRHVVLPSLTREEHIRELSSGRDD